MGKGGGMLWYGIVARASPGSATGQAFGCEPCPFDGSMLTNGLNGIVGACGHVAAGWGREGRYAELIEPNGGNENGACHSLKGGALGLGTFVGL